MNPEPTSFRVAFKTYAGPLGVVSLAMDRMLETAAKTVSVADRVVLPMLHPGQRAVLEEAQRYNVLECGRRWGKSLLGVNLLCEPALAGKPAGWFAPTHKMMLEQWADVVRHLADVIVHTDKQHYRIEIEGGGIIEFWSVDNPNAGRGRRYQRIVIDEGSVIRELQEAWEQAIRPTLTDFQGDAWFLGTPRGRNYFHRLFTRGESGELGWKSWRRLTTENPYINPDEVEEARRMLPPAVFAQEYEGIPADDGGNPFGIAAIGLCIQDENLSGKAPVAWGIDLAKSQDWTVAIGLDEDGKTAALHRFQKPWNDTIVDIHRFCSQPALVDSTGVGDPVLESLQRDHGNFEGFKFTSPSKQQLMEGLAVAIQQRAIGFPAGVIVNELESFEYEYRPGGIRYSAPSGLHDDCVCALALAWQCWQTRRFSSASTIPIMGLGVRR